MSLTRRQFVIGSAATGVAALTSSCRGGRSADPAATAGTSTTTPLITTSYAPTTSTAPATVPIRRGRRVLVVVQLGGGNDALNTLVPLDGRYHDARPELGLADDTLIAIPGHDRYGLHPALAGMRALIEAGHVAAVAQVGYAQPDRSHFVATDDWLSADPGRAPVSGWLGRYLDATTDRHSPLRAVALGGATLSLRGISSQPTVVRSPDRFTVGAGRAGSARSTFIDAWTQIGGPSAQAAADAVEVFAALKADAATDGYDDAAGGGDIAAGLTTAAGLIEANGDVEVINVLVGGFDTHSGQAAVHQNLLADLATGVQSFFTRLARTAPSDEVLLMTVSEFGRRVHENASRGTDHGKAGVQFVVGPTVRGGVIGDIDLGRLDEGDLRGAIDPRSLLATPLDWLGADSSDVLGGRFDGLGIVG